MPVEFLGGEGFNDNGKESVSPLSFTELDIQHTFLKDTSIAFDRLNDQLPGATSLQLEAIGGWLN